MAVGSIKFGGLASGIDTSAIIDALLDVERFRLTRMQGERSDAVKRQGLIRELNTHLLALREAARAIDNRSDSLTASASSEELLATSAESSNESVLTASSSGRASPGTHSVRVEQLANAARRVSVAFASGSDPVGQAGDTFTVAYGDTGSIALTLDGSESLQDLADLVNEHEDNDGSVRVSTLDDGLGGFRLVVTGTDVGSDDQVTVATSLTGPLGEAFVDAALSQDATDARLRVHGVAVTRPSNEVSDVIPGVTLTLTGANDPGDATDAVTITVSRDDEAIVEKLQKFVDSYNALREFSLKQSTYDSVNRKAGRLSGDPGLRIAESAVQGALARSVSFPGNSIGSLGQLGVRFDTDGKLALDRTVLDAALASDIEGVRELLSGDGNTDGIATALARALEPVVRSGDGILEERLDSIEEAIDAIDDRIAREEDRLGRVEESLTRRFSALEQLISTFQASSSFLDRITTQTTRRS